MNLFPLVIHQNWKIKDPYERACSRHLPGADALFRELLVQRLSLRLGVSQEIVAREMSTEGERRPVPIRSTGGRISLEEVMTRLMLFDDRAIRMVKLLGFAGSSETATFPILFTI